MTFVMKLIESLQFLMSTSAQRRLLKDLKRIETEGGEQIIASPHGTNLLRWAATIEGVEDTPWQGGLFQLRMDFSQNYPNRPPTVRFLCQMFHPNIYNDGRICLDMLQNQWSPVYDVWSILTAIRSLLADPNPLSPANMIASNIFRDNKVLYEQRVREIVEKSLENDRDEDEDLKQDVVEVPVAPQAIEISDNPQRPRFSITVSADDPSIIQIDNSLEEVERRLAEHPILMRHRIQREEYPAIESVINYNFIENSDEEEDEEEEEGNGQVNVVDNYGSSLDILQNESESQQENIREIDDQDEDDDDDNNEDILGDEDDEEEEGDDEEV